MINFNPFPSFEKIDDTCEHLLSFLKSTKVQNPAADASFSIQMVSFYQNYFLSVCCARAVGITHELV